MSDKLKELTDKLYNEGLSKGKREGEQLLEEARKEAEGTIAAANSQAARILAKAEQDAADLRRKAESDIRMASQQALQATRTDIENLLVGNISSGKIGSLLSEPDFLKSLIETVASKFSAEEGVDLALTLPEKLQSQLEPWIVSELAGKLDKGVSAYFTKKISGGFNIGPKDGSYFISLTDETFRSLISEYLRPVTRKILFGE